MCSRAAFARSRIPHPGPVVGRGSSEGTRSRRRPPGALRRRPPWPAGRSGSQLFQRALARVLVIAPAHELRTVADAVACDVVERDLADELGPQPLPDQLLVRLPAARPPAAAPEGPGRLPGRGPPALLLGPGAPRGAPPRPPPPPRVGRRGQP